MIGEYDLDGLAEHGAAGILDRHFCGNHRTGAAQIGIQTGLVVENADPDDIVGDLRVDRGCLISMPAIARAEISAR